MESRFIRFVETATAAEFENLIEQLEKEENRNYEEVILLLASLL